MTTTQTAEEHPVLVTTIHHRMENLNLPQEGFAAILNWSRAKVSPFPTPRPDILAKCPNPRSNSIYLFKTHHPTATRTTILASASIHDPSLEVATADPIPPSPRTREDLVPMSKFATLTQRRMISKERQLRPTNSFEARENTTRARKVID
jgi:hypothetical protein